MTSHEVTYKVTLRCLEMDGTPEETAEIFQSLIIEAINGHTAAVAIEVTPTDWGQA